ncbi:MAG: hypothetical protein JSV50_03065 [Desulfobacteraceae bacterium]|nr:MAG: hypothetical protein JSV50_03065 [Desulfobacteraceae bacterium]
MAHPDMILLDEPSEGLAPLVMLNLIEVIDKIRERGMTILLADQNLKLCRRVCERGCIVHEGTMEAIWSDEEVIKKYLVL